MKQYFPTTTENVFLKAETYYSKGGLNVFTYKEEKRGYYLMVVPVKKERGMESFVAFSGKKRLLKEVSRKSNRAEAEADGISEIVLKRFVEEVANGNDLTIA